MCVFSDLQSGSNFVHIQNIYFFTSSPGRCSLFLSTALPRARLIHFCVALLLLFLKKNILLVVLAAPTLILFCVKKTNKTAVQTANFVVTLVLLWVQRCTGPHLCCALFPPTML